MKKSEVIEKLKEGKIVIHYNTKNIELLRELLETSFPTDKCKTDGISTYYFAHTNKNLWQSTDRTEYIPSLKIIKLSEITEDETFEKGEMVEVRNSDNYAWSTREFIAEHKGLFICINCSNAVSSWKQIRKISPLHKEIIALQEKAKEKGITVNIEIKY